MWKYYYKFVNSLDRMDNIDWLVLMVCVVALGLVCMRGFGSRKSY